jgi:hypothetical protein
MPFPALGREQGGWAHALPYNSEHDYYSIPNNRNVLKNQMQQYGYSTARVCQLEITGGAQPPSENDWLQGCMDALHDLGFKP